MQNVIELFAAQRDLIAKVTAGASFARLESPFPNGRRAEPNDIWKARKFIEEHSNERLSLKEVADVVGINATYLSEKFKHVTGVKFVDYVARTRFERATKLLEDVNLPVSEIAFDAGFQSLSQFNRVFRKLSGKSPSEYRSVDFKRRDQRWPSGQG